MSAGAGESHTEDGKSYLIEGETQRDAADDNVNLNLFESIQTVMEDTQKHETATKTPQRDAKK